MPSQTSTADIYVNCLYSPGDGYPLWNPSPLRTGAIGYIRDGSFFTLYNIEEGPPTDIHPAADPSLVGRRRSTPANHVLASAAAQTLSPPIAVENAESVSSGGTTPVGIGAMKRASDPAVDVPISPVRQSGTSKDRGVSSGGGAGGSSAGGSRRGSVMGIMRTGSQQHPGPPGSTLSDPISPAYDTYTPHAGTRSAGSSTPPSGGPPISSPTILAMAIDQHNNQRSPRLRERDLPPDPPMPLQIEYEDLRRFDAGPRSSSTYTCLGFSAGANVAGAPVGGMWAFKSSGGDGALLIPRDPTEREQLRHVGNLKIYLKTHLRWIAYRYGISEDVEADDIALVFSQDRTSDWACAVSRNTTKGAQVEFEVFSIGRASVWGEWRTAMTASQRGPHRGGPPVFNPNFALGAAGARMQAASIGASGGPPSSSSGGGSGSGDNKGGIGFSIGGVTASFSPSLDAQFEVKAGSQDSNGGEDQSGDTQGSSGDAALDLRVTAGLVGAASSGGKGGQGNASRATSQSPTSAQSPQPGFSVQGWPLRNPHPADQAITIRRITMKHRLGFLPASIRASAGPRPDRRREPEDGEGGGAVPSGTRRRDADGEEGRRRTKALDPLDWLHEYILMRAPTARASIASDAECAFLLRAGAALRRSSAASVSAGAGMPSFVGESALKGVLFGAAEMGADVVVDEDGIATVELRMGLEQRVSGSETRAAVPARTETAAQPVKASQSGGKKAKAAVGMARGAYAAATTKADAFSSMPRTAEVSS
ncbi:hypothetical protein CF327_g4915 [Tilletia walkeri]|nr:hypothetical protein CF327_g4915 [Tilletia walkeri]